MYTYGQECMRIISSVDAKVQEMSQWMKLLIRDMYTWLYTYYMHNAIHREYTYILERIHVYICTSGGVQALSFVSDPGTTVNLPTGVDPLLPCIRTPLNCREPTKTTA